MAKYQIATIEGDGIGPEVTQATIRILKEACGADLLHFEMLDGGADHYVKTGLVLPEDTFQACDSMDAIRRRPARRRRHARRGLP